MNGVRKAIQATLILISTFLLATVTHGANIFPILDEAVLGKERVVKEVTLIPWDSRVIEQIKEVAKSVGKNLERENLYIVLTVVTDPVGDSATNRQLGIDIANWVGVLLANQGIPPDRIGIVTSREDKTFLENISERFRPYQKCKISVVRGSDLLSRPRVTFSAPPKGGKVYPIEIISPKGKRTDRASHVLKGRTHSDIKVLAVTVNKFTKTISAFGGEFETPISLTPGENTVTVAGRGPKGTAAFTQFKIKYEPPTPSITIYEPRNGETVDITRTPFIEVRGKVESEGEISIAYLIHNEFPQRIRVNRDGTFREKAVLLSEEDTFRVEALSDRGFTGVSKEVKVKSTGVARQHMTAFLTWDTYGVDLDLIVKDQAGHVTSFESPDRYRSHISIPDGSLVIDDRDGYGPEVFNLSGEAKGRYDIYVKYYYGNEDTEAYVTVILFPDIPPKKIVKVFGPITLTPDSGEVFVTSVVVPEGEFKTASAR